MDAGTGFILLLLFCAVIWFLSAVGPVENQKPKEQTIIDVLDDLYRPNHNYWTIQHSDSKYHIYLTPLKGDPMFGEGYTIEQAMKDFISKYQV
jgi:hypothetical protein